MAVTDDIYTRDDLVRNPLAPLARAWWKLTCRAKEWKDAEFQRDADDVMMFFNGTKDDFFSEKWATSARGYAAKGSDVPQPEFQMVLMKPAEAVQLFGPTLYANNPTIEVTPVKFADIHPAGLGIDERALQPQPGPDGQPQPTQLGLQYEALQLHETRMEQIRHCKAVVHRELLNYGQRELNKQGHMRQIIDEALLMGLGVGWCLSATTEVYVRYGDRHSVAKIRDVCRNWMNAELWDGEQWRKVVGAKANPAKGDELKITLRSGEHVCCTREHMWPTKNRGIVTASELTVGDELVRSTLPEPDGQEKYARYMPCSDIGWFVGLYLGDGTIDKSKNDVKVSIACHEKDTDDHARLARIARDYGGTATVRQRPGEALVNVDIYCRALVAMLRDFVDGDSAHNKRLRPKCWEKSNGFLAALLEGYLDADGHYVEKEHIWRLSFCLNHGLASSIRTICARLGHRLTLKTYTNKMGKSGNKTYYKGAVRTEPQKWTLSDFNEIVEISDAHHSTGDTFYDVRVDGEPHLFALASGLLTHNCEKEELPSGGRVVGTFYDTVRNLLLDPDADNWDDMQWIARERCMPYWEVEEKFRLPKGSLAKYCRKETVAQQEMADASDDARGSDRKTGKTNDLITFREIYSKMGIGDRLKGVPEDLKDEILAKGIESFDWDEIFGQYCYLAVAHNIPFPLNLHPSKWDLDPEQLKLEAEWPIPFWLDNEWPCTPVAFHPVPGHVWPMSHFKPGLGELKWLTWAMSFLANKVRTSCGTIIGVNSTAADEVVPALESKSDNRIVKITQAMEGKKLTDFVDFLQQPQFHADIYTVIQAVMNEFDKRIGLSEILYGMTGATQDRSATESNIKQQNASARINDMTRSVETALSQMARKEALANRWYMDQPQFVQDILGPQGTQVWVTHVLQEPIDRTVREYDFKIVAGSTRKQDKQTKLETLLEFSRNWGPMLQAGMSMGMLDPVNNLMLDTARFMDLDEPERYLFVPPPPQPPPPDPKAEAELQKTQLEMQQSQEQHQLDMQLKIAEMQMRREEAILKQQEMEAKLVFEAQKQQMELAMMREKAQTELLIEREKAQQSMQVESVKAQQQLAVEETKAEAQAKIEEQKAETQLAVEKQKADASIATQKEMTKAKVEQTKATGKAQAEAAKMKAKATPKKPKKSDA